MLKKLFLTFVSFVLLLSVDVLAASYKGQRVYAKRCVACHGRQEFIGSKTKQEWKAILGDNGTKLAKLHLESKKAKKSWKYFKGARYKKKLKHLKDFLVYYAKDSGRVPACSE